MYLLGFVITAILLQPITGFSKPRCIVNLTRRLQKSSHGSRHIFASNYDPFTSDPTLSAAVNKELDVIRKLTSVIIKQELAENGIRTASMSDRRDLDYALAVCRVKKALKSKEDDYRRSKQAMMIADEVEKVKKLTDKEVINELHQRGIKLGRDPSREVLEGKLATARVEGIEFEENKKKTLKEDLNEIGQLISSGASKAASSSVGERVINFAKARTFTDAELTATEYLSQQQGELDGTIDSRDNKDGLNVDNNKPLTEDDFQSLEAEIATLKTFDNIVEWAHLKPRSILAYLLERRNERVPRYAPHSAVVRLLADSVMTARTLGTGTTVGEKDNENQSEDVNMQTQRVMPMGRNTQTSSNRSVHPAITGEIVRSNGGTGQTTYNATTVGIDTLDTFSFEKGLLSELGTKLQQSTSSTLDSILEVINGEDTSMALQRVRAVSRDVAKSGISEAAGEVIRRGADLGSDAATRIGKWAGGSMLSSGQVTFIAAFVCILRRRGIATYMGTLIMIRILGLLTSLEEREREWENREQGILDSNNKSKREGEEHDARSEG